MHFSINTLAQHFWNLTFENTVSKTYRFNLAALPTTASSCDSTSKWWNAKNPKTKIHRGELDANALLPYSAPDFGPQTIKRKGVSVALWTDRCWCSQCHQNLNSKQWKRGVKNRCILVCLQHFFGSSPGSFLLVLDLFFFARLLLRNFWANAFVLQLVFVPNGNGKYLTCRDSTYLKISYFFSMSRSAGKGVWGGRSFEMAKSVHRFDLCDCENIGDPQLRNPQNDKDEKRARSPAMEMW